MEKAGQVRGHGPELRHSLRKAQDAWRLPRPKKKNQADEHVPVSHPVQPNRVKVYRPRRLSPVEAGANKASDLQNRVEQVDQPDQPEQPGLRRHQVSRVHRRGSRSVVASQRDDPARSNVHGKVSLHKIHRRVRINQYGLARRHRWVRRSRANLAEVHNQDRVSR